MTERDFYMGRDGFYIRQQPISGPLKVYQGDRFMGTVPEFPVKSTSGIFDVRPNDFKPVERDGETVLAAHGSICPGDWACVAGFVPAADLPGSYSQRSEAAELFDALHSLASVGRNAKRQDAEERLGPKDEHAVPPEEAGDAQRPSE